MPHIGICALRLKIRDIAWRSVYLYSVISTYIGIHATFLGIHDNTFFRVDNFRGSYLLTKCPKFHQINIINYRMVTGFLKWGYNRKLGKN
jgi:hypothetical protein